MVTDQKPIQLFGPADIGAMHGVTSAAVRKALSEESAMPQPQIVGSSFVWAGSDLPAIAAVMARRKERRKRQM